MKIITITLSAFLICVTCNQKTSSDAQNEKSIAVLPFVVNNPLEGVWKFTKAYTLAYGDTVYIQEDHNYYKIYHGDYFMWMAETNMLDSIEWNAFGKYELKNGTIFQTLISGSESAKIFVDAYEFTVGIELDGNSFVQSTEFNHNDTTFQYHEYWKRLH